MSGAPSTVDVHHGPGSTDERDRGIRNALGRVYDPCSVALNNPLSILDMGLIRSWDLSADGAIRVVMCVTSPACFMAPKLTQAARDELARLDFITSIEVEVDPTVVWEPEYMTEVGRGLQRRRHSSSQRVAPVRPQQWRGQARSG